MAAADTARLIAQLILDDKNFTKGLSGAERKLGKFESTAFRVGQHIGSGAKATISNVAKIGVASTVGIAGAVKVGLDNLAQLESAITSVDGAIDQMGLTGQLTGKQVAGWANDIERDIGAAFDDKEITAAAATLVRFGKVTPKNLKPALKVVADLAVKTGDVESASELLAKALADPAKAAGKLARQGIILTKAQQDQIKAMLEVNDVAGAQQLILDEVAKTTEGAAAASAGPYQRSLNILKDVFEDTTKALAIGFLPVISKVSDLLGKELAKPETLANIQKFGEGLASGLADLIEVARNLPWAQIGESLKIGAAGATTILKMFTGLPPWVQTAVLTGWGLNKLTGGSLGGIVSELGKGLIKGVLGINAGVVNINAGVVNGAGGIPGTGAPAGGGVRGAVTSAAKTAALVIPPLVVAAELQPAVTQAIAGDNVLTNPKNWLPPNDDPKPFWELIGQNTAKTNTTLAGQTATSAAAAASLLASQERTEANTAANQRTAAQTLAANERNDAILAQKANEQKAAIQTFAASERAESRAQQAKVTAAAVKTAEAARWAGSAVKGAVDAKDLSVAVQNTNVVNAVFSVRETIKTQVTHKQFSRYVS